MPRWPKFFAFSAPLVHRAAGSAGNSTCPFSAPLAHRVDPSGWRQQPLLCNRRQQRAVTPRAGGCSRCCVTADSSGPRARVSCHLRRPACGPMNQWRREGEKFRPPGQFVALVGCYTKARPAGVGCYTAEAAASSPRCDGPLLSAVAQQRLQPPARGVTAPRS